MSFTKTHQQISTTSTQNKFKTTTKNLKINKTKKKQQITKLKKLIINNNSTIILTNYQNITINKMFEFRHTYNKKNITYHIIKNTLTKLTITKTNYKILNKSLKNPINLIYSNDTITPTKILTKFVKHYKHLKIKTNYLNNKKLETNDIDTLTKLPNKNVLQKQLLNIFNTPTQQFINMLTTNPQNFLKILSTRKTTL